MNLLSRESGTDPDELQRLLLLHQQTQKARRISRLFVDALILNFLLWFTLAIFTKVSLNILLPLLGGTSIFLLLIDIIWCSVISKSWPWHWKNIG